MHGKSFTPSRVTAIERPVAQRQRPKRIDLVVTDYEISGELAGLRGADGLQSEFRCTIPLAILDGSITSEALREVARFCRPSTGDPINEHDFLRLIEQLFGSLNGQANGVPADEPLPQTDPADEMRIARLTPRELQVLEHVVAGDPNKRTAAALNISRRTVEHHRAVIMQKTRTKSVPDLVRLTLRTGLFSSGAFCRD